MQEDGDLVEVGDETPKLEEQARIAGWRAGIFDFGIAEEEGISYFNPGIVRRPDGLWLIVRRSVDTPGMTFGRNDICAFKLHEETRRPEFGRPLVFPDSQADEQFEDARVCRWNDQTWVSTVNFIWYGDGSWTGAHICLGYFRDDPEWTPVARRDPEVGTNLGHAGHTNGRHNKNLLFWFHNDKLHLIYTSDPWDVVEFGSRWEDQTHHRGDGVKWKYGHVRGGTPPVLVDGLYWTFFHSSVPWHGRLRRYYMGAMAFEAVAPFKPIYITPEPLLIGSQKDFWHEGKPLVVFPCGALYENEKWFVTFGVNDLKSGWCEIPHEDLKELAQPKPPTPASILLSTETPKSNFREVSVPIARFDFKDGQYEVAEIPDPKVAAQKAARQSNIAKARAALAEKRAKGLLKTKHRRIKRRKLTSRTKEVVRHAPPI